MADETQPAPTFEEQPDRLAIVRQFYDCKTADERKALATKYPWLKEVFSESSY